MSDRAEENHLLLLPLLSAALTRHDLTEGSRPYVVALWQKIEEEGTANRIPFSGCFFLSFVHFVAEKLTAWMDSIVDFPD